MDSRSKNIGVGCHAPLQGIFPGLKPASLTSPALAGRFFTIRTTWEVHSLVGRELLHFLKEFSSLTTHVMSATLMLSSLCTLCSFKPLSCSCGSDGKESACNAGDPGSILGQEDLLEKGDPVFLPGEFHEQRSLVGYSPWGHKESDTSSCI